MPIDVNEMQVRSVRLERMLTLTKLGDESVDDYLLVRFEGREAICEPFDYSLELVTSAEPDPSQWIGKPVIWSLTPGQDMKPRDFGGQVFDVRESWTGENARSYILRVCPVFLGAAFTRGISVFQDKSAVDILKDLTNTLPGFQVVNRGSDPPPRPYTLKYDESEFDFLRSLLAQEGIFHYFEYSDGAAPFKHRMVLGNAPSGFSNMGSLDAVSVNWDRSKRATFQTSYFAHARDHGFSATQLDTLDKPFEDKQKVPSLFGDAYDSRQYEYLGGVQDKAHFDARAGAAVDRRLVDSDTIIGSSNNPYLMAGGVYDTYEGAKPPKMLLKSVVHSCSDPGAHGGAVSYQNSFTGMDAARPYRPPVPTLRRRAPGPILGTVQLDGAVEGEIQIDDKWRVPVAITHAHPRAKPIWLPVRQAWTQNDYGSQFFPRIGTTVMIDFLYGDPDLPFVAGCFYTPTFTYPLHPSGGGPVIPTRSGWRSKTEKNGAIAQEIMFDDEAGKEEIHIYTGGDFRRQIDKNEKTTINMDNTKLVKGSESLTVGGDRTIEVSGKQSVHVTKEVLFESDKSIEIKVGESSIKLTPSKIEIKSTMIDIKADAMGSYDGGGQLTLKGGMIMIN